MSILEIIGILAFIATGGTSIAGWVYTVRKNGKDSGQLESLVKQNREYIKHLPCINNPNYGREWGQLLEKVNSSEKRLEKIENAVEGIRRNNKA